MNIEILRRSKSPSDESDDDCDIANATANSSFSVLDLITSGCPEAAGEKDAEEDQNDGKL